MSSQVDSMGMPTLDQKIEYLLDQSVDFDPEYFTDPAVRASIISLMQNGMMIRADNFRDQEYVKNQARYGLGVFSEKHQPMIYLNVAKHETQLELADTIFHEALHCSAQELKRHKLLPEEEHSQEYQLEELCVLSGLCKFYPKARFSGFRPVLRRNTLENNKTRDIMLRVYPANAVRRAEQHGETAANWLYRKTRHGASAVR